MSVETTSVGIGSTTETATPHLGSIDPDLTLTYYSDLFTRKMPWMFALCLVIGIWAVGWMPGPNMGWLGIPVGVLGLGYSIVERVNPQPMLVLTPDGIGYRNISKRIIPWQAIADITVTTHSFSYRGSPVVFENVTVIWISNADYDREIFAHTNPISRGPNWDNNFIREGGQTGIVIPHEMVQLEAAPLRGEIMARWEKFSGRAGRAMSAREQRRKMTMPRRTRMIDVVFGLIGVLFAAAWFAWDAGLIKAPRDDSAYWKEQQARNAEIERKAQRISDEMKRKSAADSVSKSFPSWMTDDNPRP